MGRISRFVKDIESCESKYDLVRCDRLSKGGTGLFEKKLDGWVGSREDSIVPI